MRGILISAWDVRRGERARAALMFGSILLLIAAYTTTKAVRDAVFLTQFGLTELSYVMIGIAVAAGCVVSLFTRLTSRLPRSLVGLVANCVVAVTLVLMAPALEAGWAWVTWALYFWSSVFGLILMAEFWLLANDLFHAREAKRLFPLIGAGAILGGVAGGALSSALARPLGATNLIYVVAALLVAAGALSYAAWRFRPEARAVAVREPETRPSFADGLRLVKRDRYVRQLALMMLLMTVSMTFVQWQYKGLAKFHFDERQDAMTAFFGVLQAVVSGLSFLLQVLVTPWLLKRFGVKAGLRVLPAGFLIGAVALAATGVAPGLGLPAAVLAVVFSDGLRFSVDKASVELLYLPIPRAVKDQAKPFVDTAVDRFGGALAGFLWLFMTFAFDIDHPRRIGLASVVTAAVVLIWLGVIARARRGYVEAYRRMIAPAPPVPPRTHPKRVRCEALLRAALTMDAPARTRALRATTRLQRLEPGLRLGRQQIDPLLWRETRVVRLLARALVAEGAEPFADRGRARPLLVRALEEKLDHALERIGRLLALVYSSRDIVAAQRAFRTGTPAERAGALELLDNLLDVESKGELMQALDEIMACGRPADRGDVLRELARGDDPWLRTCAAWALAQELGEEGRWTTPHEARC